MNFAIIVAAGSGSRFGADEPKQFAVLAGKPLIFHTIEQFQACSTIDSIVLVVSESGCEKFARLNPEFSKLQNLVTGGATRAESVRNGLAAIGANDDDIIAVHDGARPLVTVDEITRTVEKAAETGAACLVVPVVDTIKEVAADGIVRTIDRSNLRRALTPQAFRFDILKKAFDGADVTESITDECSLVERLGVPIAIVEGGAQNIKITQQQDIAIAEALLETN